MLTDSGLKGQNLKNTKQPKNKESVEKRKSLELTRHLSLASFCAMLSRH
jgi:hypothetical protein